VRYRKSKSPYGKHSMEFDALQYLGTNAEECICFGKGASAAAWLRRKRSGLAKARMRIDFKKSKR
jgi:hypothetical protein